MRSKLLPKPKKQAPPRDSGYSIAERCECGGKIRTWIEPDRKDYIDPDGNPVRHGERIAKCLSCWKDRTGMVAELIARGTNR